MASLKERAKVHEVLYIELDCLLDTRYGVLVSLLGEKVQYVLANGYFTRIRDEFKYGPNPEDIITREQFKEAYDKRSIDHLKQTIMTPMLGILTEFVEKAKLGQGAGDIDSSAITINTYPYQLDDETKEALKDALRVRVNPLYNYSFCYLSPADLNPVHCRSSYSYMVMYDAGEWLSTHAKQWHVVQTPDVVLSTPMLLRGTDISDEELVKEAVSNPMQFGNDKVDPQFAAFRATQLLAQQLVGLQYLPVKEFSVMTK